MNDLHCNLEEGDIIGFRGRGPLSWMVNWGTWGGPRGISHIAIVGRDILGAGRDPTQILIYESTSLCKVPCHYQRTRTEGVQAHHPRRRIPTYKGKVTTYRLMTPLCLHEKRQLGEFLYGHIGTQYDSIGAFRTRSLGFWERWLYPRPNLEALFCSEYVAAALKDLGRVAIGNPSHWNPNRLLRYLLRENVVKLVHST